MELLQLKYFAAAAKYQSFTKVAKQYIVPPSSVSHTISKLEDELGMQLFSRNGNKIELNDYGRAFYANISTALDKIADGKEMINSMRYNTVNVTLRSCAYSIIPMLTVFRKSHPDIKLSFDYTVIEQKGSYFIRISAVPFPGDETFNSVQLFSERIRVAIPSCNPLAAKSSLTFADIKDLPVIWFFECQEKDDILNYYKAHGAQPNILIVCGKDSTVAEFVKNDFGIAFYPEYSSPIGKTDGITTLPLESFNVKRTICASWPREFALTDASKVFVDFAVAYFKKYAGAEK